jgi:uncharacterized protein (TIGR02996 family)
MSDESAFLRAIADNPGDESCRLVFADWLEERGDWRSEFLRLDCALRRMTGGEADYEQMQARWWDLRGDLDPTWRAVLGRYDIENCGLRFRFRCPQRWDRLKPTELPLVRHCDRCREQVFYCGTIEEAREHARLGHCVAVDVQVTRREGDLGEFEEEVVAEEGEFMGALVDVDEAPADDEPPPHPPRKRPWWKFW